MTFHIRDLVRFFKGFGAATDGQVLAYNATTQRPEWRDASTSGPEMRVFWLDEDSPGVLFDETPTYLADWNEIPVEANAWYGLKLVIHATEANGGGVDFGLDFTGTLRGLMTKQKLVGAETSNVTLWTGSETTIVNPNQADNTVIFEGIFNPTTESFSAWYAQNQSDNGAVRLKKGSYLVITKLELTTQML